MLQFCTRKSPRRGVGGGAVVGARRWLAVMVRLSAKKQLAKPLLFGSLLCALATAFVFRRRFFPEIEEFRAQEYQRHDEKRQEVLRRRQQQLAEIAWKRSSS